MKRLLPFLFLLLALTASAQKRPMTAVDMFSIPTLGSPELSPNGSQFVYVLGESDWKQNKVVTHIWRGDMKGEPVKLTNGENGESSPAWSPDGTWIAFITKRPPAEENQIYLIRNAGGEAWALTKHKTAVRRIEWADSKTLYFLASEPKTAEEVKRDKAKDDVYAYDENFKQTHLWRMSIGDSAATRITEGNYSVTDYALSRAGDKIILKRSISPLLNDGDKNELWLTDKDGKGAVQLTSNKINEGSFELSPDGKTVSFVAAANGNLEGYYNNKLFALPISGGQPSLVSKDFPFAVDVATWSRDGKSIHLLCNKGLEEQLFNLSPTTGKWTEITKGNHSISSWNYQPALDQHLFAVADEKSPGDIHLLKGVETTSPTRLTHVFDYLDRDFKLPKQERVNWKGADGVTVEGLLIYPNDYVAGKLYPLVVQTHGGPRASDQFGLDRSFASYATVLAAKEFMILQPNYRGSTGYGDPFLRDMVGSYFKNSHLDVMAGVDYLIGRKLADPDKLIKMGWSAGGHMTNKLITFTDRFKVASSGAGAANWISMYAQSDMHDNRTPWFGGTPWQKDAPIDTYWNNSPLKDISNVKTPTLFLVGGSDVRVPLPQSVEMYKALKSNGVPTHLYVAPREPHGWGELRHRLYKVNVELEWFLKYALGEVYAWEKAPEK